MQQLFDILWNTRRHCRVVKQEWASSVNFTFTHPRSGCNSRMRATIWIFLIIPSLPFIHPSIQPAIHPSNHEILLACLVTLTSYDKTHNSNTLAYAFTVLSWHISYHSNMCQQVRRDPSESLLHGLEFSSLVLLFILLHTLPQHLGENSWNVMPIWLT